jgi:hypothetical protein
VPGGILGRTAAVAFVHDDKVKEAGRELAEELLTFFRAGDRLLECEVNLVRGVDPALLVESGAECDFSTVFPLDGLRARAQLCHLRAEGPEVIHHGLIHENIAVGQEEDALLPPGFP